MTFETKIRTWIFRCVKLDTFGTTCEIEIYMHFPFRSGEFVLLLFCGGVKKTMPEKAIPNDDSFNRIQNNFSPYHITKNFISVKYDWLFCVNSGINLFSLFYKMSVSRSILRWSKSHRVWKWILSLQLGLAKLTRRECIQWGATYI